MINAYTIMMALVLFAALLIRGNLPRNRVFVVFACLAMFVVLGFRDAYSIGNDSASSYLHEFQAMDTTEWSDLPQWSDFGENAWFHRMMKLFYLWSNGEYQVLIVTISAFVIAVLGIVIFRYSTSPVQSIVFYWGLMYYSFQFNALKQSVAMALVLLAFDAIMRRKPVRFVLLVLIASQFHFPSLVFLPAYWISRMKFGRGYFIVLGIVLLLTYLFRDQMLEFMLDMYDTEIHESGMRFFANKVIVMLVIVVAALLLRVPSADDEIYNCLLMFAGIAIVIQTFAGYNNTFERLADYYFQFAILLLPMVFDKGNIKRSWFSEELAYMAVSLGPWLFGAYGVWRFATSLENAVAMLPYHFCF